MSSQRKEWKEKIEALDRDKPGEFGDGYRFAIQEVLEIFNEKE